MPGSVRVRGSSGQPLAWSSSFSWRSSSAGTSADTSADRGGPGSRVPCAGAEIPAPVEAAFFHHQGTRFPPHPLVRTCTLSPGPALLRDTAVLHPDFFRGVRCFLVPGRCLALLLPSVLPFRLSRRCNIPGRCNAGPVEDPPDRCLHRVREVREGLPDQRGGEGGLEGRMLPLPEVHGCLPRRGRTPVRREARAGKYGK